MERDHHNNHLRIEDLAKNPMLQFDDWFKEIKAQNILQDNAMNLATVSPDGQPTSRTVLLKYYDDNGFVFYTNYESRKAEEITRNAKVGLCFYWKEVDRQVRVDGVASKVPTAVSMKYYFSRPRESQIGAWCSEQSKVISSRQVLISSFQKMKEKLKEKKVPYPPFWGGYLVQPEIMEFWQAQPHRLHDRFRYQKKDNYWEVERLAP